MKLNKIITLLLGIAIYSSSALASTKALVFAATDGLGLEVTLLTDGTLNAKNITGLSIRDTKLKQVLFEDQDRSFAQNYSVTVKKNVLSIAANKDLKAKVPRNFERIYLDTSINAKNHYGVTVDIDLKTLTGQVNVADTDVQEMSIGSEIRLVNQN